MTDKPIIFSADMIRAMLEGRKTQTRRMLRYDKCGAPIMPIVEGDQLWVKEAWRTSPAYDDLKPSDMGGDESIFYEADETWESWGWGNIGCVSGGRYRHARFMPRWASRLTLVVTDVSVHRVQEISEDDAFDEGVKRTTIPLSTSRVVFRDLWNSIHGPGAWDRNDWVAAVSFEVIRANIDEVTP